jgi:hypothetical protein
LLIRFPFLKITRREIPGEAISFEIRLGPDDEFGINDACSWIILKYWARMKRSGRA